jgi:ABC-type hemin transport system substrate-binding protein
VARGPQFLALESALNRGVVDLQAAGPRTAQLKLIDAAGQLPATWSGKQAYRMEGLVAGKPKELVLVPFADARTYRVWLLRP